MPGPISDSYRGPPAPPGGSTLLGWAGKLSKIEAIKLIDQMADQEDAYWCDLMEDYYDEESDTMPSIFHVFAALGVTREEYLEATGRNIPADAWPEEKE